MIHQPTGLSFRYRYRGTIRSTTAWQRPAWFIRPAGYGRGALPCRSRRRCAGSLCSCDGRLGVTLVLVHWRETPGAAVPTPASPIRYNAGINGDF
jgi:hypothetical protein